MLKSNLSIDLNYNLNNLAIENLFNPTVNNFLKTQNGCFVDFTILEVELYISYYDFKDYKRTPIKDIYLSLLDGIGRDGRKVNIPISVFITFDKRQCPSYCASSNRYFSSVKVGGVSKIYYILFTMDEVFDFLYSKENGHTEEAKSNIVDCDTDLTGNSNKDIVEIDKIISENEHIKGYLDNHNLDKGLSFVSCSDESGYPIYHRDFPSILEIKVGSVLELEINSSYQFGKVIEYHLSDDNEINGLIQFFDGVLSKRGFSAYINISSDDVKTIFVPSDIAKNFEDYSNVDVSCLARNKKPVEQNQYKWVALQVVERK